MLSVSLQRKYNFYHKNTLLDAFRTNYRNIIGRNPSMVIPLLANQDLTPMLFQILCSILVSNQTPSPVLSLNPFSRLNVGSTFPYLDRFDIFKECMKISKHHIVC